MLPKSKMAVLRLRSRSGLSVLSYCWNDLREHQQAARPVVQSRPLDDDQQEGISSLQIQRQAGFGSYETALDVTHKIRAALIQPQEKLGGIVEVDETFVGGKVQNKHRSRRGPGGKSGPRWQTHFVDIS